MISRPLLWAFFLLGGALLGCVGQSSAPAKDVLQLTVAEVSGSSIRAHSLGLQLLRQYGGILAGPDADWNGVALRLLDQEIDMHLLAEEATRRGIKAMTAPMPAGLARGWSPAEMRQRLDELGLSERIFRARLALRRAADELVRQEVDGGEINEAEIEAWIQKNPVPERVQVRHLVVRDKGRAQEARQRLKSGASFAETAMLYGEGPEARRGGLLPPYSRQQLPGVFDAAFELKPGQVSEALPSEHGWHLLRLERKLAPEVQQREAALSHLIRQRSEQATKQLLDRLRAKASIRIDRTAVTRLTQYLKANQRK